MKTRVWREGKRCSWEEDRHRFTYPFSRGVLRQEGVWLDEGFKVETKKQVPLHNNTPVLHQFPWRLPGKTAHPAARQVHFSSHRYEAAEWRARKLTISFINLCAGR